MKILNGGWGAGAESSKVVGTRNHARLGQGGSKACKRETHELQFAYPYNIRTVFSATQGNFGSFFPELPFQTVHKNAKVI